MTLPDRLDGPLDYQAEIRPDGVIDIPGDRPAPHGPGLSKGLAIILLGLLIGWAGHLFGGIVAAILIPAGGALALWTLMLLLGLPLRLKRRQATGISTSLRRRGPGMNGEL